MDKNAIHAIVGQHVYIAPTAYVGGEVVIGDQCTVMHHVVIRGDVSAIRIGCRVNFQDGVIVHTNDGVPLDIEDDVSIGHRAVVHCRRVGAGSLIGTGAIVLDDCEIGRHCIIGAGAVVPPNTIIPDGKLALGVPAKVVRDVKETELAYMRKAVDSYLRLGPLHSAGRYPAYQPGEGS
jgi:carbonic anhydrase/acetyltransferase-like protein (isoleucine patch superfamily)